MGYALGIYLISDFVRFHYLSFIIHHSSFIISKMRFLLLVRVATIAVIYALIGKFDSAIIDPLSTFVTILHELGHSAGAFVSGGVSMGYTLTEDSPRIYSCTKGGSTFLTVLGGNLFSLSAAWLFVWLGKNGERQLNPIFILLGFLMFFVTRLFNDAEILPMPIVVIYLALFGFFILTQSSWSGAFLIFFGILNLLFVFNDAMNGGVLSDVSRFAKLLDYFPQPVWTFFWLGTTAFVGYYLFMEVATAKVEWASGRRFFKNLDLEKIGLFIEILPNLIVFGLDQLFEFLVIQFSRVFDFRKR
jgi:Peptidase M50B-like